MFFGLTIEKIALIAVIAGLVIGPERLPRYAESLARLTKRGKEFLAGARTRMREEMGDEFDEVDWRKLDPRQYDPRRIIREALLDEPVRPVKAVSSSSVVAKMASEGVARRSLTPGEQPPFDGEAT